MNDALATLHAAQASTGSLLSIGLEPSPAYLPPSFEPTIEGHERFLRLVVESTADLACAFKPNLAFFETLGADGWALLERVRAMVPADRLLIADAKRSDIGTSAARYAEAMFDRLGADACTVNPLMGRDSLEPFLSRTDRLTFALALTSNPGASDLLLPGELWKRVIDTTRSVAGANHAGFVVGATRGEVIAEARAAAGDSTFLVPGLGAQGGDLDDVLRHGSAPGEHPGLVLHVTRGVLPGPDDADPAAAIRTKAAAWNERIAAARASAGSPS